MFKANDKSAPAKGSTSLPFEDRDRVLEALFEKELQAADSGSTENSAAKQLRLDDTYRAITAVLQKVRDFQLSATGTTAINAPKTACRILDTIGKPPASECPASAGIGETARRRY